MKRLKVVNHVLAEVFQSLAIDTRGFSSFELAVGLIKQFIGQRTVEIVECDCFIYCSIGDAS